MTLDITVDHDAEEVVIILDNHKALRANKGEKPGSLILCKNFKALEYDEEDGGKLFSTLRLIVLKLFALEE